MSGESTRDTGAASELRDQGRWYHLDGTECVAGHDADTMMCAEGGGRVIAYAQHWHLRAERLERDLAEAIACRDAALRQAAHVDQPIDVALEDLIGDGLTTLGVEWEESDGPPDTPPDWLVAAVVGLVRPVLAAETARREQAETAIGRMRTALEEIKLRTVQRDLNRLAAAALGQPPAEREKEDPK